MPSPVDESGKRPLRVAAYCRYSSHMQDDGYSIPKQHHAIEAKGISAGNWDIDWRDEPARSAYAEVPGKRPVWDAMMADARSGRYDLVVVWKLNRFSRRASVAHRAMDDLLKAGCGFISMNEQWDMTTPHGWLMFSMSAAFNQFFSMELAQEVRHGLRERAETGLHVAGVPFGYRRAGRKAPYVPDTTNERDARGRRLGDWEGLQTLGNLLLGGMTDQEAADAMNRDGRWMVATPGRAGSAPRPFTRTTVQVIRRNVFYRPFAPGEERGTIYVRGVMYRGQHQAAFSWDDWQTMQQVAKGRRRGWTKAGEKVAIRAEPFTVEFRGLAACEGCGRQLHVHRSDYPNPKDGLRRSYERYKCMSKDCGHYGRWARAEDVREAWVTWLEAHPIPQDWEARIRHHVYELMHGVQDESEASKVIAEQALWEKRRKNALTAFLDGNLDESEYRKRLGECDARIAHLIAAGRGMEQHTVRLIDAGRLMVNVAHAWRVMRIDERVQAAQLMIETHGLIVRPTGKRGNNTHHHAPSCENLTPRLREPFRELLAVIGASDTAAG